ncbi:MAG: hypothetical protein ACJAXM_000782 [Arenicella sp.]|jgi:hypothetical protein
MTRYWSNILLFLSVLYNSGYVNIASEKGAFTQATFQSEQITFNDLEPLDLDQNCTLMSCFPNTQCPHLTAIQNQQNSALVSIKNVQYIRGPPYLYI